MRGLIALAALVALSVFAGCETRTRDNPFDPLNPATGGRPALLNAAARDGFADLRWTDGGMTGIESFTIYKGLSPDSLTSVVAIPAAYHLFREGGLTNGNTYYFAIGFQFFEGDNLLTAAEPVTPGPDVPWVLDVGLAPLALLGSDGRSIVSREASGADLVDLSMEPGLSLVWCIDPLRGQLMAYDQNGTLSASRPGFDLYNRVSADLFAGGVWTISFNLGILDRVDERGRRTTIDTTLVMPLDVDASPLGGCWVSDAQGLVHRYSADGTKLTVEQVARPTRLSATGDNSVWVADPLWDEALKISNAGIVTRVSGLQGPFDVAATPDGGCWIADRTRVLRVDAEGEVLVTTGGFAGAGSVDYNPRTGECWVADSEADLVVRLSPEGERLIVLSGLTSPFEIAGRWGRPN